MSIEKHQIKSEIAKIDALLLSFLNDRNKLSDEPMSETEKVYRWNLLNETITDLSGERSTLIKKLGKDFLVESKSEIIESQTEPPAEIIGFLSKDSLTKILDLCKEKDLRIKTKNKVAFFQSLTYYRQVLADKKDYATAYQLTKLLKQVSNERPDCD